MTQEAYVASVKKVLRGDKAEPAEMEEKEAKKKSTRYLTGLTLGVIAGAATIVALEALLILMLVSVLGGSLTYLQCLAISFAVSYFATKFK